MQVLWKNKRLCVILIRNGLLKSKLCIDFFSNTDKQIKLNKKYDVSYKMIFLLSQSQEIFQKNLSVADSVKMLALIWLSDILLMFTRGYPVALHTGC